MNLAISLLVICALGKFYILTVHDFEFTFWTAFILLWQDVLVAVLIGFVSRVSTRAAWFFYVLAIIHFAISMPLLKLMASPLTMPLLRAARGTLSDSIGHHVDPANMGLILGTLVLGVVLPFFLRRIPARFERALLIPGVAVVVVGIAATSRSDVQGLHRNSLIAFTASAFPARQRIEPFRPRVTNPNYAAPVLPGFNLILVALESTGARFLKPYGSKVDPMPHLTRIAESGVVFENAYAAYPESIKGLLTVLASRQPAFGLDPDEFGELANPSLASVCAGAGYDTALFHSGRFMYLGMDDLIQSAGFSLTEDAGAIGGNHHSSFGVDDFSTVDRILDWMDRIEGARPFFVHYLPVAGHHPYDAPLAGPFPEKDDPSRHLNALHYSDVALKRLLDGMETRGLLANTLVVIYGDHGEAFGEHPGNFAHTLFIYEENVHVPLILWAGEKLQPGRLEKIVSLVDIGPTVCHLLGLEIPPRFEGISAFESKERPAMFLTDYSMRLYGLRFDRWKFIYEKDTGYARLYDLECDPSERMNLAESHPEMIRDLKKGVFEWSGGVLSSKLASHQKQ